MLSPVLDIHQYDLQKLQLSDGSIMIDPLSLGDIHGVDMGIVNCITVTVGACALSVLHWRIFGSQKCLQLTCCYKKGT